MGFAMSKYALDKLIWQMSHQEDSQLFERYMADPDSAFIGCDLTSEERTALSHCDIGELYRMGAQPFILLAWSRRIAAVRGEDSDAFIQRYIAAVKPHGLPDYST